MVEKKTVQLYKLTDAMCRTGLMVGGRTLQWGPGITHTACGGCNALGTAAWIHAFTDPLVGLVVVADRYCCDWEFRLWKAEGDMGLNLDDLEVGCTSLTTVEEIALPVLPSSSRVRLAIICAGLIWDDPDWKQWAEDWLSGRDRSRESAEKFSSRPFVPQAGQSTESLAAWDAAMAAEMLARGEELLKLQSWPFVVIRPKGMSASYSASAIRSVAQALQMRFLGEKNRYPKARAVLDIVKRTREAVDTETVRIEERG